MGLEKKLGCMKKFAEFLFRYVIPTNVIPFIKKIGLNMFLVPQISVKFRISSSSKPLTNLVFHL